MNNEPMNAPARPLIAGELRESGFLNKVVLKVFSSTPFALRSSASLRISDQVVVDRLVMSGQYYPSAIHLHWHHPRKLGSLFSNE